MLPYQCYKWKRCKYYPVDCSRIFFFQDQGKQTLKKQHNMVQVGNFYKHGFKTPGYGVTCREGGGGAPDFNYVQHYNYLVIWHFTSVVQSLDLLCCHTEVDRSSNAGTQPPYIPQSYHDGDGTTAVRSQLLSYCSQNKTNETRM